MYRNGRISQMKLTDTPEKQAIEKEYERKINQVKKKLLSENAKGKKETINKKTKKPTIEIKSDSSSEEDVFCLVCVEAYTKAGPEKNGYSVWTVRAGLMRSALMETSCINVKTVCLINFYVILRTYL
jgi:hypothetical protein